MSDPEKPASIAACNSERGDTNVGLPTVAERDYVQWGAFNPSTGGYAFTTEDRTAAERMMRNVARSNPDAVLIRQPMRSRCETWWGEVEVVPWHTPCDWVGMADEDGRGIPGTVRCFAHKHDEGEPVPAEYVRGSSGSVTPPVNRGGRQ